MAFEVMNDCIHLKACRRVQAIGRTHRLSVPRYCTEDCTAYVGMDEVEGTIIDAIQWAFERGRDGNDYLNINSTDGLKDLLLGEARKEHQ